MLTKDTSVFSHSYEYVSYAYMYFVQVVRIYIGVAPDAKDLNTLVQRPVKDAHVCVKEQ